MSGSAMDLSEAAAEEALVDAHPVCLGPEVTAIPSSPDSRYVKKHFFHPDKRFSFPFRTNLLLNANDVVFLSFCYPSSF